MTDVLFLDDCDASDTPLIGGKGAGLVELWQAGMQVPPAFIVTTDAYRAFLERSGIADVLPELLEGANDGPSREAAHRQISEVFRAAAGMKSRVWDLVRTVYDVLDAQMDEHPVAVAVRSSATAEDTAEASFAGEYESELWIRGADEVCASVARCWASLFNPHALAYLDHVGVAPTDVAMAVVVQVMVPAEAAGVMMTLNPVTGARDTIVIESALGLGLGVVDGHLTPDHFELSRDTYEVGVRMVVPKARQYAFDAATGRVRLFDVPTARQREPSVSDDELADIARLGIEIDERLGKPMDIEWAIGRNGDGTRRLYLLQARPETVWSRNSEHT
jgi:pyruvate,water dikinase